MKAKDFSGVTRRLRRAARESVRTENASADQQNLRSIQQLIEAIDRGDLEAAIANAHDNVRSEICGPPEFQWIRKATGPEELREALRQNFESLSEQHPEVT